MSRIRHVPKPFGTPPSRLAVFGGHQALAFQLYKKLTHSLGRYGKRGREIRRGLGTSGLDAEQNSVGCRIYHSV